MTADLARQRLDTIRDLAADSGADAAAITRLTDVRWAVGFTGSNGLLIVTPRRIPCACAVGARQY